MSDRRAEPADGRSVVLAIALALAGLTMADAAWTRVLHVTAFHQYVFFLGCCRWLAFALGAASGIAARPVTASRSLLAAAALGALGFAAASHLPLETFDLLRSDSGGTLVATVLLSAPAHFLTGRALAAALAFPFVPPSPTASVLSEPSQLPHRSAAALAGLGLGPAAAVLALAAGWPPQQACIAGLILLAVASVPAGRGAAPTAGRISLASAIAGPAAALAVSLALAGLEPFLAARPPLPKTEAALDNLETWLLARKGGPWRRGELHLRDGSSLLVETTWPPTLTADGLGALVETLSGPREVRIEDVQPLPPEQGPGLRFHHLPWLAARAFGPAGRISAYHWPAGLEESALPGLSPTLHRRPDYVRPRQLTLAHDGHAAAPILRYDGGPLHPPGEPSIDARRRSLLPLGALLSGLAYTALEEPDGARDDGPGTGTGGTQPDRRPAPAVLSLLGAGGLDVLSARWHGAGSVTVVEPRRTIVDMVRGPLAGFSGGVYDIDASADLAVHTITPREYLEQGGRQFDLITCANPETHTGSLLHPLHAPENDILTVEGFRAALRRLEGGGVLALGYAYDTITDPRGHEQPIHALRLLATACAALGRVEPDRLFLAQMAERCLLLVRPDGFSEALSARLAQTCAAQGFTVLWGAAGITDAMVPATADAGTGTGTGRAGDLDRDPPIPYSANPYAAFLGDPRAARLRHADWDLRPTYDDRPFFQLVRSTPRIFRAYHGNDRFGMLTANRLALAVLALGVLLAGWLWFTATGDRRRVPSRLARAMSAGLVLGTMLEVVRLRLGGLQADPMLGPLLLVPAFALAAAFAARAARDTLRPGLLAVLGLCLMLAAELLWPAVRAFSPILRAALGVLTAGAVGYLGGALLPSSLREPTGHHDGNAFSSLGALAVGLAIAPAAVLLLVLEYGSPAAILFGILAAIATGPGRTHPATA